MSDETKNQSIGIGNILNSELARQIYGDGLQKGTIETGNLIGEISKTVRLMIQPTLTLIQNASTRLDAWASEAINKIPPERLTAPNPAQLRAVATAIGTEADESQLRDFYVKLLSKMMDKEFQQIVHPSIPRLLQDLSPLDALLLQITGQGSEVDLPNECEISDYQLSPSLVATWDAWEEGGIGVGIYRFFRKVHRLLPKEPDCPPNSGRGSEHAGFLELILPQRPLFEDQGISFGNLSRLGLAHDEPEKIVLGTPYSHFSGDIPVAQHFASLFRNHQLVVANFYYRTSLGRRFAECCIPKYEGKTIWHPKK